MNKNKLSWIFICIFFLAVVYFYKPFFIEKRLPIPSDTIVGLYHPFRDLYEAEYPRGIPFKNFLITDPVRQIYVWKNLSVDSLMNYELPLWNPYEMAGKPLMGNFQSSPFYPLNIIFIIRPFEFSWSIFILLQSILAGTFMFLYLRNLKLLNSSSVLGALAFSFSGFSVAWLEWGSIVHTGLWLPLILLSIDKNIINKKLFSYSGIFWNAILVFAVTSSFLAGNIQIFFYVVMISFFYALFKWFYYEKTPSYFLKSSLLALIFILLTFVQAYQTLVFILNSARDLDRSYQSIEGWFFPWQNLIQFIAPDYFGNPATLNYWGVWNYGELIGYVGIVSLIFSVVALISVRRKVVYFFSALIFISILFATQNIISELPFIFNIPFLSTAQPTRLIFIAVFSLCVLGAFGINYMISENIKFRKIVLPLGIMALLLSALWTITYFNMFQISHENISVSLRNLFLPTTIFGLCVLLITMHSIFTNTKIKQGLILLFIIIAIFDLVRFANKFTPFTVSSYLFPKTKITEFLMEKSKNDVFRIATLNDEIMPPNFATYYRLQSVSGYDPLYLLNYAEFIAANERNSADITPPYGFNRIINPKNYDSNIFRLLNVKYVLTFDDINDPQYKLAMQEGKTKVYEKKDTLPRSFFIENLIVENNEKNHIGQMFNSDLSKVAFIFSDENIGGKYSVGEAIINSYSENSIEILTDNLGEGFLVLSDAFYPLWEASIDNVKTEIYRANYTFRGIKVPAGKHKIIFKMKII